jgi:flagellar protein FliL
MAAIRPGRPGPKRAAQQQQQQAEAAAPPPPPPAAQKGRSMTVPALLVAVAVLGAAFLLRGGGSDEAPTQASTAETTVPVEEGPVVALEPITMNLLGGDHLKVAIALQLAHDGEEVEDPASFGARALDVTIEVLGEHSRKELEAPQGRAKVKAQLSERVAAEYHGDVTGVYFTQFVIA